MLQAAESSTDRRQRRRLQRVAQITDSGIHSGGDYREWHRLQTVACTAAEITESGTDYRQWHAQRRRLQ